MRKATLAVGLLLLLAGWMRSWAGEDAARTIPDVATLEQLERLEPHRVAGDWEVRLGLGEPGADGGPWKLLYCYAKYKGDGREPKLSLKGNVPGEPLGPVFFRLGERAEELALVAVERALPVEGLYCAVILTAWEGSYPVCILSADGKVIARRTIEVEKPAACYWQCFATLRDGEYAAAAKAYAAVPDFGGLAPLWPPAGQQVAFAAPRDGTPLPGQIPLGEPWDRFFMGDNRPLAQKLGETLFPLKLSLEGTAFVVRAGMKMLDWADFALLARWWVNGKLVVPPRSDGVMMQIGRAVSYGRVMKVSVGWPDGLGQVKVGDRLGLQVLYSPALAMALPKEGHVRMLRASSLQDEGVAPVPLLSSRIEFAVTDDLLRARARHAKGQ